MSEGNGRFPGLPYIEAPKGEAPVVLQDLRVEAALAGLFAETTQTMRFHNPNRRDLEGSLVFPLPDGAVVCGCALDVGGRMVDGVVVAKQEARRILEAEVRKGVDPGLVEQVQGNVYRTRVYPLPAGGTRTVRLTYTSELALEGGDATWHLPLAHASEVALRIAVQAPVAPVVSGGPGKLQVQPGNGGWVVEATLGPGSNREDLRVRLPGLPDRFAMLERTADGEVFFCLSARMEPTGGEPLNPRRLAIAWDASGSRGDVGRDLALLRELSAPWGSAPVDLVVFRERPEPPRAFPGLEAVADWLEDVPCDGATDLASLDLAASEADCWLLFTDGLDTLGRGLPQVPPVPVFAVTSQARNHGALLEHLARGGRVFNLLRTSPGQAAQGIATHPPVNRAPEVSGSDDFHVVRSPGRLQVLGRLSGPAAVTFPGEAPLRLDPAEARPGRTLARAWAGREAAAMELRGLPGEAMVALGRRYGLVTPGTSLLVLETLEQYLEYDLEPPESLPEMLQRFRELREDRRRDEQRAHRERLERVVALWEERVRWWETDFRPAWKEVGRAKEEVPPAAPRLRQRAAPRPEAPAYCAAPPMEAAGACPEPMMAMDCGALELEEEAAPASTGPVIRIQPWSPDTPYLEVMRRAGDAYAAYLEERPGYAGSPSFFLDCGDHLLTHGRREEGLRVLSNLLEMGLDDPPLMRMVAWRLQQAGELDGAVEVLERVLALRRDEPQSFRDLALALGDRWQRSGDPADAARAVTLLYEVVLQPWDRFPEIELIALMELNRLLHLCERAGVQVPAIDPRLRRLLDLDLRISLSWDADLTDVDLHVLEPTGEHAYYGHRQTAVGGLVSRDFRDGYGPEEYVLRRAYPGTYAIQARYYGSHQQTLTGACTVLAHVFTDYGRPNEARQVLTLRLDRPGDQIPVGEVTVAPARAVP